MSKPRPDSICAQCAVSRGACCEVAPGEKLATLTFADIERIEAATGLSRQKFVEREDLDPAGVLSYELARPMYAGLFVGGIRYGLKSKKGSCVFLEPGRGCTLPGEAKPVACHLYPFDFDFAGELSLVDAPHCLALERAQSGPELLRMFGASRAKLRKLQRQAVQEVAEHSACLRRERRSRS